MCKEKCCKQGARGPKGPKGDRGPQGPPGEDAELIFSSVADDTTQDIVSADGQTTLVDMTIPVVAGSYAVWFDASITDVGTGVYGVYFNGVLQNIDRLLPGSPASISLVDGLIVIGSSGNLTVDVTVSSGVVTVRRASFIVQKIA